MLIETIAQQNDAVIERGLSMPGLEVYRFGCAGGPAKAPCGGQEGCELLLLCQGEMQLELETGRRVCAAAGQGLVVAPGQKVASLRLCGERLQGVVMAFARETVWKVLPAAAESAPAGEEPPYHDRYQMDGIRRVQAYLMDNLEKPHTIEKLSETFHISSTLLKEGFKQMYGLTIRKFLQVHRMARAAELLCTTSLPILQVAEAVGYDSASQFGVIFKRQYRLTPSQYRRRLALKCPKPSNSVQSREKNGKSSSKIG